MAQSNAERQRKHRRKVKGSVVRTDLELPIEVAAKLGYLAHYWGCTRRETLSRLLMETWQREGSPIPGYEEENNPLPHNDMKAVAVYLTSEALEALRRLQETSPAASMGEVISVALVAAATLKPKAPAPAPMLMPILLSTTETARRLQVTVPELTRWRKQGRGPRAIRVKDSWRYSEQDIENWIQEGRQIAEQF